MIERQTSISRFSVLVAALAVATALSVNLAASPEEHLNDCQQQVHDRAADFLAAKVQTIGECLSKIAKELVRDNQPDASGAGNRCVEAFGSLFDLEQDLRSGIARKCDPAVREFTLEDLLGEPSPGVSEPLNAAGLEEYCLGYGGDGSIDDLDAWVDCLLAASECGVDASLAAQYPRALEWLERVRPEMVAAGALDAVVALDALFAAIDGEPAGDLRPDICCGRQCGGEVILNELRIDQPGSDVEEYFELAGPPGQALDGLTYLVIGDVGTSDPAGRIEAVVDLNGRTIGPSGFFVAAEETFGLGTANLETVLVFENGDNVTHLLVRGFTGSDGQDLDTDNDGTLDFEPWRSIVSCVGLVGPSDGPVYCPTVVGPDVEFVPAHVYLCPSGWIIGAFDPVGGDDTPGTDNDCPFD